MGSRQLLPRDSLQDERSFGRCSRHTGYGYNPEKQVYTYNVYNSLGEHQLALGEVHGNIWTWTAEEKLNDVITKGRYTITITSPTTYEFKSEVATPTGAWSSVMEGKAVRSQPRGQ